MNLIPDVPAKLFTLSAIAFGYILIDDLIIYILFGSFLLFLYLVINLLYDLE